MKKETHKTSGDFLRELRKSRKWEQTDLAHAAGISQSEVSNLETGKATFSQGMRAQLKKAFGFTMEELEKALGLTNDKKGKISDFTEPANDEVVLLTHCLQKMSVSNEMERVNVFKLLVQRGTNYIQWKEAAAKFLREGGGVINQYFSNNKMIVLFK